MSAGGTCTPRVCVCEGRDARAIVATHDTRNAARETKQGRGGGTRRTTSIHVEVWPTYLHNKVDVSEDEAIKRDGKLSNFSNPCVEEPRFVPQGPVNFLDDEDPECRCARLEEQG